jgi:hypothetical protein
MDRLSGKRQTNLSEFKFPKQNSETENESRLRFSNMLVNKQEMTSMVGSLTKITNISVNSNRNYICASTNKGKQFHKI